MFQVEIKWEPKTYYDMVSNQTVCSLYHANAVAMGQDFERYGAARFGSSIPTGSTDMGNVSYEVPSIHPCFYIGTDAVNHTRGFTVASGRVKLISADMDNVSKSIYNKLVFHYFIILQCPRAANVKKGDN